ncbi:RHS repeat domain-containing protein, partial [Bacteroides thetaiotaomicron]
VKAKNCENLLEFTRDRKTGLITEERQGEYTVSRTYDGEGNCTRITSSLGADIRHTYDREGNLQAMQAGESWQASWVRDNTGLEVQRIFSGGVTVSTERDRFGCEVRKSVRSGGIERGAYRYEWGIANRLLSKENELTGTVMRYDYDRFDFLIRQETTQGSETDVIYRVPDFVGNLFGTPDRKDRKYGAGGKLLEDPDCFYHYDDEGNLIFREFKQLQETGVRYDRKRMEKERDIRCLATGTGWLYEWASNGMLKNVIRPDGRPVEFRYDALGRRTAKLYFGKVTRWVWDGNVPLHEWITTATDNDVLPNRNNITTWIFEEETLIPTAKIQSDKSCSIVSDYLGTPIQMYDGQGNKTWDCTLDIYGKVIDFTGKFLYDCPFRFQGQYEDAETGLYYNRFRYYSAEIGCYLTHDPIGLAGGILIYGYVSNPNSYIDPSGESSYRLGKNLEKNGMNHGGKVTFGPNGNRSTEWQAHHIIPEQVWRRNNVFFKEIGLRGRDSASNGVFLPNSKEVSSKNSLQYFHCGSHPDYNVTVDKEIKKIEAMYEFEKNNIKPDIAKANAINRIRNLQNDFRQKMSAYYTGEPASINNFH